MKDDIQDRAYMPTLLADRTGNPLGSLTEQESPPSLEQLEARLSYAARVGTGERLVQHVNPLLAAAGELLGQVVSIATTSAPGDIHALNDHLCNQVKVFEVSAEHHRVPNEQMTAARYVLCTVLDETVLNTRWGSTSDWSRISLLSRYHKETLGGEKFFQLLERLSSNPTRHLHMLELMYVCLALGFEGKYRAITRGSIELDEIREAVFRQIRHLRGDQPRELSPQWRGAEQPRQSSQLGVARWQLWLITALCLLAMYSGFAWVLGNHRTAVLAPFEPITITEPDHRT